MRNARCHILCWLCAWAFVPHVVQAQQLKLGNHPLRNTKSAVLELESTNQGLLLTRIADTNLINAYEPPDGMIIYFTDGPVTGPLGKNAGLYERLNGQWWKTQNQFSHTVIDNLSVIRFYQVGDSLFLNIPNASGSRRGVVSGGKQTFYGKKLFKTSITLQSLHPGSILFVGNDGAGGTDTLSEANENLFWNIGNNRLGIGTNSPSATLDVNGNVKLGTQETVLNGIIRHTYSTVSTVINANSDHTFSATVAGAIAGGSVAVSPAEELPDGLVIAYGYASTGIIYFKLVNTTASSITIPAGTIFHIAIVQ